MNSSPFAPKTFGATEDEEFEVMKDIKIDKNKVLERIDIIQKFFRIIWAILKYF